MLTLSFDRVLPQNQKVPPAIVLKLEGMSRTSEVKRSASTPSPLTTAQPPVPAKPTVLGVVPEYLTVAQVACHLGVGTDTVYHLIKTGQLEHVQFGPRLTRVSVAALRAYEANVKTQMRAGKAGRR